MEKEFTELLFQNQGIVHKISNIYFYNRANKEYYTQELIIQLWKAFPSFKNQSKFSTWMYRVCLNAAIDILRKEKAQPKLIELNSQNVRAIPDSNVEINDNKENYRYR